MSKEIRDYVSACEICKAAKSVTTNHTPPLGRQKLADYPGQIISADYLGEMTRTARTRKGDTFLLVISDWFSKEVVGSTATVQGRRE
jgi:hypothetical protein